jgi:hypothetical protein
VRSLVVGAALRLVYLTYVDGFPSRPERRRPAVLYRSLCPDPRRQPGCSGFTRSSTTATGSSPALPLVEERGRRRGRVLVRFRLLRVDGEDLRRLPWEERRARWRTTFLASWAATLSHRLNTSEASVLVPPTALRVDALGFALPSLTNARQ